MKLGGSLETFSVDRRYRRPRYWSNSELAKFAHLFSGKVANVSAWRDSDKQGHCYREYFRSANEYWITNYKEDARGWQGNIPNEIFLDLEQELPSQLDSQFDVVFNHTTLEHVFDVFKAFTNLAHMSRDIVILVVPFMQEQHGNYGDYWRFTPRCIFRLFKREGMETIYINDNDGTDGSLYIFAIGSRCPENWTGILNHPDNKLVSIETRQIGTNLIRPFPLPLRFLRRLLGVKIEVA